MWKEEYSVSNAALDAEHKKLFGLLKQMRSLDPKQKGSGDRMHWFLNEMMEYSRLHFEHEEREMDQAGYPGAREHARLHLGYVERVSMMCLDAMGGALPLSEAAAFLEQWWVGHILSEDKKYAAHCMAAERGRRGAVIPCGPRADAKR